MTKRFLSLLTAVLILFLPLVVAEAEGSVYWDSVTQSYCYDEPHYGIVICRQMNVRNRAATSGTSYGQIKNGQPVKIFGVTQDNNFYVLDLQSCGFANAAPGSFGYAKSSLIKIDPQFIHATKLLDLYATPWGDGKKNGEQTNRFFLIVSQYGSWYAVQTQESAPGTSFINAGSIPLYYQSKYVVTWDAPLYDDYGNQIQTAKRFTFGYMENQSIDRTKLVFNRGEANEFRAWIPTLFIAPVID